MAYNTGSITNADPGPTLYTALATILGSVTGMSLVDTVVISTRTHKVWKSAAANNSQNLDWYLDISYPTTGTGNISFQCFEYYDPATDLGYRGLFGGNVTTIETTYYSRFGATGNALETNWMGAVSTYQSYVLPLVSSTFGYWFAATADRVVLLLSNAPTLMFYCGFYQPDPLFTAKVGAANYPLIGAVMTSSIGSLAMSNTLASSVTAAITRMPLSTVLTGNGWAGTVVVRGPDNYEASGSWGYPLLPTGSTASYPYVVGTLEIFAGSAGNRGRFGTLRDMGWIYAGTVARGDTVTVSGTSWVLGTSSSSISLAFKAA